MNKKIGVIGGMGPMASQLFYKMITEKTEAEKDQDHVNLVLVSDASMPDRTSAILAGDYDEVSEKLLKDAKILEMCGCEAIGITCNTAHFFADLIKDELEIPIIHMIEETVQHISRKSPGAKVAVLATDGTIKTQIYQKRLERAGLKPYIVPAEIQEIVMYQIYDCIKSGKPYDKSRWGLLEKHLYAEYCDCAIMACTELSVIKADDGLGDFYIDPMEVLSEKMIQFSGRQLKA